MFSRIRRVIRNHREGVGMALTGIGPLWLMIVAGADDYNTAHHVFTSFVSLVIKTGLGLLFMGAGVRILNGGNQNENSL